MPHNAPRSLTTFVAILMSVGLLPTAAKSQANDFAEAIQTLAPNSTLPGDFITTYIDIPDVSLIAKFSETTLREFWTENDIHHLAISYTTGPCSDVLFVTLDDHGDVIDYQQILRGCDMDGGGDRHEGYDYTIRNDVKERAHHVEEVISDDPDASLDENETRSYTYYSYFEIRSDGHVTPLSLPDEVDSRRSYMQASQRLLTPEELALMEPDDLRLMRNEIFAAYGHIFDSTDLQEYFRAQPWYDPAGDATNRLTDIERRNIQLILRAENN